ncbi:MAG: ATP-binding protein [Solirubrobacteraceae bacterium]
MSDRVSPTAAPATRDWPLVGRDAELQQIAAARASPSCPGVVISGAVGVGRSRLARETVADADRAGDLTYWAQGTRSSATIPLGAFAALIPDDCTGVPLPRRVASPPKALRRVPLVPVPRCVNTLAKTRGGTSLR